MTPWNSGEDEILIKFVRQHKALYSLRRKDNRKVQLKQKLWRDIAAVLNKTDTDCYKRWCYIQDYYMRRKRNPVSSGETAKNSDLLTFLDNLPSSKHSSNAIKDAFTSFILPQKNDDVVIDLISDENQDTDNTNKNDDAQDSSGSYIVIRKNKSDRKCKHIPKFQGRQSAKEDLDETDLFFSSMAKIVKKLPRHDQAHLRMEIGLLVGNAELGYISNKSRSNQRDRS